MLEKLVPLKLPPGIYRSGTTDQAGGRWVDAHLVRFVDGTIQPVGGWRRAQNATSSDLAAIDGIARAAIAWRTDVGVVNVGIGTTEKLMALVAGTLYDITPAGFTAGEENAGYSAGAGDYGNGDYGAGNYGIGSTTATLIEPDTWQLDTFGDYLAGVCTSDGILYVWDANTANDAAEPAGAPVDNRAVVCTPERFLMVLGADGNPRLVKWASQETTTVWTPSGLNTAGEFPLSTPGRLMCGRASRGETLLWTDCDLWSAQYLGGTLVYAFRQVGKHCGTTAPNGVAMLDGRALWMGLNCFWSYDGFVLPVACEVADYVFNDFNRTQRAKVFTVVHPEFGEAWWYYPSASSDEIDRYVIYNYRENHWSIGAQARTAAVPAGAVPYPILIDEDGLIYEHEYDEDRGSEEPYLQSGPLMLGDGDQIIKLNRLVPDERTVGDCDVTIYTAMAPTDTYVANGPYTIAQPTDLRLTARQIMVRFTQALEKSWRIGRMKLGIRPGGRR